MTTTLETTYNGYTNYETWNVALWLQNDEFLYNTARACVEYCGDNETPYEKFVRCMCDGIVGRHLVKTPDGVLYNSSQINTDELNEMITEL